MLEPGPKRSGDRSPEKTAADAVLAMRAGARAQSAKRFSFRNRILPLIRSSGTFLSSRIGSVVAPGVANDCRQHSSEITAGWSVDCLPGLQVRGDEPQLDAAGRDGATASESKQNKNKRVSR
jgi:hypothetical protein